MAISHVGTATSTTASVTVPAATQANDLILLVGYDTTVNAAPTDYTTVNSFDNNNAAVAVYSKIATGSDGGASVTVTGANAAAVSVYRGIATADPIGASNTTTGTGTSMSIASLTLQVSDGTSWAFSAYMAERPESTFPTPSGTTELWDFSDGNPGDGACHQASVTSYTPGNITITRGDAWGSVSVEILNGAPQVTGQAVANFGGTFTTAGIPRTPGQAAGSFGGTFTAAGVPETFGVAAASFGGTHTAAGVPRKLGQSLAPFGGTFTASGTGAPPAVPGQAVGAFGGTFTGSGTRQVLGVAVSAFGGALTASGTRRPTGSAVASLGGTFSGSGRPRHLGLAAAALGGTFAASGAPRLNVAGQAVASLGGTFAVIGLRKTTGSAAVALGFEATASGERSTPLYRFEPPTHEEPIVVNVAPLPRFRLTHAASVVKVNGVYRSIRTPDPTLLVGLEEGVDYFIGGHVYQVTTPVAQALQASGFSAQGF